MSYHVNPFPTNPKTIAKSERKRLKREKEAAIHNAVVSALQEAGYRPRWVNWAKSWSLHKDGKCTGIAFESLNNALKHFLPGRLEAIELEVNARLTNPK